MAAPGVPNWQAQILHGIGAPVTPQNLTFLNAWARAEGGSASNNPFNTTQHAAGAGTYNSVGVRNYTSPQQGIAATVQTLLNGRYGNILGALHQGRDARAAADALANSPWGTGSLVQRILGSAPTSAPSTSVTPPPAGVAPAVVNKRRLSHDLIALFNQGNQMFGLPSLPSSLGSAPLRQPTAGLPSPPPPAGAPPTNQVPSVKGRKAVNLASHLLGIPYRWGGESLKGFDCSGLLQYVWGRQGVEIPRTTYQQFTQGSAVNPDELRAGDAVFFKGSDSKTVGGKVLPGHVGIYIGAGKFIEAPHTGSNVRISTLAGRKDFMGGRRYAS